MTMVRSKKLHLTKRDPRNSSRRLRWQASYLCLKQTLPTAQYKTSSMKTFRTLPSTIHRFRNALNSRRVHYPQRYSTDWRAAGQPNERHRLGGEGGKEGKRGEGGVCAQLSSGAPAAPAAPVVAGSAEIRQNRSRSVGYSSPHGRATQVN